MHQSTILNRMQSLNGWQRLWLVIGVIYLFVVGYFAVTMAPHDLTINEYLGGSLVNNEDREPDVERRYVRLNDHWVEVATVAHNPTTNEYVYLLDGKWSAPAQSLVHVKIPRPLDKNEHLLLLTKQAKFLCVALLWWLIPWLLLYLGGISLVWVLAGFRRSEKVQP